jgi:hypothetical protein
MRPCQQMPGSLDYCLTIKFLGQVNATDQFRSPLMRRPIANVQVLLGAAVDYRKEVYFAAVLPRKSQSKSVEIVGYAGNQSWHKGTVMSRKGFLE